MAQEATMVIKIKAKETAKRVSFDVEGTDSQGGPAKLDTLPTPADLKGKEIKKIETCVIFYTNPCIYFMHGGVWYRVCY